jgi:hypothetical protein
MFVGEHGFSALYMNLPLRLYRFESETRQFDPKPNLSPFSRPSAK